MRTVLVTSLVIFLTVVSVVAKEDNLSSTLSLKIITSENGIVEHYEFHKPSQYTYVKENRKYRGVKAKRAMNALLKEMHLSENALIDDLVSQLRNKKFKSLDHLEIRWLTGKNELYTWVWNSD